MAFPVSSSAEVTVTPFILRAPAPSSLKTPGVRRTRGQTPLSPLSPAPSTGSQRGKAAVGVCRVSHWAQVALPVTFLPSQP